MNKVEFMRQLESLLQNISEQERQEALQYYGDYFDDAGPENEQAVLEALGNPARVAENIRRDLYGAGYGDGYEVRKPVTGRELTEYGAVVEESQNQGGIWQNTVAGAAAQSAAAQTAAAQSVTTQGAAAQGPAAATGPAPAAAAAAGSRQSVPQPVPEWRNAGQGARGQDGKKPLSGGIIALIVILCILCSPVIGGLLGLVVGALGALLGLVAAWFCMILGFGIAALVCILAGVFVSIAGVVGMVGHPLAGMGLVGGGFIAVGVGIFFLMLTVVMAGVATPAIFRGIGWLFNRKKKAE